MSTSIPVPTLPWTTPLDFSSGQLLLVDKPLHWTSFDVVNKVRHALRPLASSNDGRRGIKVGHAGTLDPLATGLLLLATGRATREIANLQGLDKVYSGKLRLGETTPTFDGETQAAPFADPNAISWTDVVQAAEQFCGTHQQRPPIYSAVKVDGKRGYRAARQGKTLEMPMREITVQRFDVQLGTWPEVHFIVHCSKGTYIRSLVHDLGQHLGVGAWLRALRREAIGSYTLAEAGSLDDVIASIKKQVSRTEQVGAEGTKPEPDSACIARPEKPSAPGSSGETQTDPPHEGV